MTRNLDTPDIPGLRNEFGEKPEVTREIEVNEPEIPITGETVKKEGREVNEDALIIGNDFNIVCDGMGGYNGGAEASKIAALEMAKYLRNPENSTKPEIMTKEDVEERLRQGFESAQAAILSKVKERENERKIKLEELDPVIETIGEIRAKELLPPDLEGMGTTMVASKLFRDNDGLKLAIGRVGDSSILRFRNGKLEIISTDENSASSVLEKDYGIKVTADNIEDTLKIVIDKRIARGDLDEKKVKQLKAIQDRSLGEKTMREIRAGMSEALGMKHAIHIETLDVKPGDIYINASDGFTTDGNMPEDAEKIIADGLANGEEIDEIMQRLIKKTKKKMYDKTNKLAKPDDITISGTQIPIEDMTNHAVMEEAA